MLKYILDGHKPVIEKDLLTWGRWFEEANRIVALDYLTPKLRVSTVFLGIDHSWMEDSSNPVLFETMIFRKLSKPIEFGGIVLYNDSLPYQDRYCTWQEALEGHEKAVQYASNVIRQRMRKRKKETLRFQHAHRERG